MAYLDRALPESVERGAVRTATFRSNVVTLASGHEERNRLWSRHRLSYEVGYGIRSADDMAAVLDLFAAAGGRVDCFRFRDWQDHRSGLPSAAPTPTDQSLGVGDGVTTSWQVVKRYGTGAFAFDREILLPRQAGFRVAVAGAERLSGWTLSTSGGVLTFSAAPAAGQAVTAGFVFDVPVRFDSDDMATAWEFFSGDRGLVTAPDVSLIEVRSLD